MSARKIAQESPAAPSIPVNGSIVVPEIPVPSVTPLASAPNMSVVRFRVDQDFGAFIGARKIATAANASKTGRKQWVQIHPAPAWHVAMPLLDDDDNTQRIYAVVPDLVPELLGDVTLKLLVPYATRTGNFNLWPIRLPDESGRLDGYNESALTIVTRYGGQWIRVLSNQEQRRYDVLEMPPIECPAPKWPAGGFQYLFELAFQGRIIDRIDHPVLKTLRGGKPVTPETVKEVVFVDFEFAGKPGEQQRPICAVAKEKRSGRVMRVWLENNPEWSKYSNILRIRNLR